MQNTINHKLNTIKWIGFLTMLIDHIGFYLFPQFIWLRIIGRIAFPCFLYSTIEGTMRTRNHNHYIRGLLILGIISMPFTPTLFNVLFLLALFSLSIRHRKFFIVFLLLSIPVEYGVYGFLFGWAILWLKERNPNTGALMAVGVQFLMGVSIQVFSLIALPLFLSKLRIKLPKLPRYFLYWFYPVHQAALIFVTLLIN